MEENEKCIYVSLTEDPFRTLKYFKDLDINWNKYIENKKQQGIKNNQIKEIRYKIQELESNLKFNTTDNKKGLINIFKKINKNSKIKVESAGKDMGTTFIVSLPAGEQEITNSVEK